MGNILPNETVNASSFMAFTKTAFNLTNYLTIAGPLANLQESSV